MNPSNTIHFVLVGTTHAGNIGAAARAMKTMGFDSLRLVNPCRYLGQESLARASGADGIVKSAKVYDSLEAAIADCRVVYGTSTRARSLEWNCVSAREAASRIVEQQDVAVVFGRERSGLSNDELALCTHRIFIPSNPAFSSLNLGSAVQVIAYDLSVAKSIRELSASGIRNESTASDRAADGEQIADSAAMERYFEHLQQTLIDIDFLDPDNPRLLMQRLRRYFGRNRPLQSELNIFRGILTGTQRASQASGTDNKQSGSSP